MCRLVNLRLQREPREVRIEVAFKIECGAIHRVEARKQPTRPACPRLVGCGRRVRQFP